MAESACLSTMHEWESPDYEPSLPVSEKSNPLTRDIDRASANGIVRMLQACDAQMFQEETGATYQRLLSKQVVETLMEVAKKVERILKDPRDSVVVLSGCGTSGRLAFLITSTFNRALRELNQSSVYSYIIAGGDRALLSSQEAPEDDPKQGMLSLKKVCEGKKRVLFIGISCGLSAPFVAGQLDLCLQHPEVYTPVLVGFNPTHQARDESIPGCTFTFHSVAQRMQELTKSQKAFLINPAVGPEAISGSSRMKGGSATKILLEVILSAAHAATFTNNNTYKGILQHMRAYEKTLDVTFAQKEGISALLEAAGKSLQCGRRVCYLGWGSLATLGLIDASECIPTFGADYEDVRGFISGGYRELNNNEGPLGPDFCIAHEDFLHLVLPFLNDQDIVLLIYTHSDDVSEVAKLARRVREKTSNLHAVYHRVDGDTAAAVQQQWELSTKLLLNTVSTGAHVLKGKIYQNYMIDVQVTNSKLYCRATRLLQKLSGCPESQCEEALLKTIYRVDKLTADITSSDIATHTLTARNRTKVVPLALVCLLTGCSLMEAETHLEQQPIVREAVEACLS
ncbi:glucokinase regulatory protein isoform X2 [Perca fluviatilis]|uniref:glucokinase regulatory protein isoform X2 n=1 Tax=Perca fluviatilis TaxID=8168 RepID=UPI0019648EAB|nr:glucokinase regulatory protein isoform X2 [Perca fluviatilis]